MTSGGGLTCTWPLTRLKHRMTLTGGGTPPVDRHEYWEEDEGIPWVTIADMTRAPRVRKTERTLSHRGLAAIRSGLAPPGTVLLAMYASVGKVARLDVPAAWNQAIIALMPHQGECDGAFLAYWLESLQSLVFSLTRSNTQDNLNAAQVGNLPFPLIPLSTQQSIADFLDRETARIDALVKKKRRMIELIRERANSIADSVIWAEAASEIPLMYAVDTFRPVMYGIVLPGPDVPEGVPIVKGGDVSANLLSPDQLCRTTKEIEAPYARARLRAGDVLFAIRGGVGDAALVPLELEGGNITQDVARVAPAREFRSDWLLRVMRTRTVQARASRLITGATIKGLNIRDLERIHIPWSTPERQESDLATLRSMLRATERLDHKLTRQLRLLAEHRQALIVAAATGQIDLTGEAA